VTVTSCTSDSGYITGLIGTLKIGFVFVFIVLLVAVVKLLARHFDRCAESEKVISLNVNVDAAENIER